MSLETPRQSDKVRIQRYQTLLEISEAIASNRDLASLFHNLAQRLRTVVDFDAVSTLLYDPARDVMRMHMLEPPQPDELIGPTETPVDDVPSGWAWKTQEPLIIQDAARQTRFPQFNKWARQNGVKSYCALPLTSAGRRLGALGFASVKNAVWNDDDLEFLTQVARQVAVAIDNAINFESLRSAERRAARDRDHSQLLLEINNAVGSHLDLRELLRVISPCLRKVIHHDVAGLALHDAESRQLRAHALNFPTDKDILEEGVVFPMEGTPSGLAFTTRRTVIVRNLEQERFASTPLVKILRAEGVKSGCSVPLIAHGEAVGVLTVMSLREEAFSESDAELLTQVGGQIALAVENALSFDRARRAERRAARERDRIRLLLDINNAIVSHLELGALVKTISASLRGVLPHDAAGIALYEPEQNLLREYENVAYEQFAAFQKGMAMPLEGTPAGLVFTSGRPLLLKRPDPERFPVAPGQRPAEGARKSACLAPLISHGRKLGILGVGSAQEDKFTEEDLELLTQIADQVAIAVENSVNFERARDAERELERKFDHLRLMLRITNTVVSQLDLRELLDVISASIREAMSCDTVGVGLYNNDSKKLIAFSTQFPPGHPFREKGVEIPLEGAPGGLAFTSGQPVFLDKPDPERFNSYYAKRIYEDGYRSGGSIPLIAQGRKLGVLGVASKSESSLSDDDKELLVQVANQVAIAVDNALNYERARVAEQEANRQSERSRLLLNLNNAIASALNLPALFRAVSASLRQVFQHDFAVMGLFDELKKELRAYALDGAEGLNFLEEGTLLPLEGTPAGLAVTTKQVVIIGPGDADKFSSEIVRRSVEQGLRSSCSAPLIRHNRVIGAMTIASKTEAAFSRDDGALFMQIAGQVAIAVENALAYREIDALKNKLASEKLYLEDEIRTEHNFEELIGASPSFKRILKQVETVAPTDSTVLIRGETGTGKELIARAIHSLSGRSERTLVKINCAAIPTGLLESELFGHEKGAFTGAIAQRVGRFELAHKGTLFLDEVGDIPFELQPKLLRVLQEQEFERLGSARTQKVDVRLIAATNADLEQMVADKKYRGDLYYRLNVFPITIPPLRERPEDIPALTRFFAQKYARRLKKRIEAIPSEVMTVFTNYRWPGNVRELEHFVERAVVLTQGSDLEVSLSELKSSAPAVPVNISTLEVAEREHITRALDETNWVIGGPNGAAARLGMKRTTLQSRMQKLGIFRQK